MGKQKTTIYLEQLDKAYSRVFEHWCIDLNYHRPTGKMNAISVVKELIRQARSRSNNLIYKDGNRIVIREITGLYNLGSDYTKDRVQAVLRGLECNYYGLVHTAICLDLNSAVIDDLDGLVKELIA